MATRALLLAAVTALLAAGSAAAAFPGRNGKIAFSRSTDVAFHYDVFTMRSDGTVKRNVTSSATDEFDPAWSADGRRFAYVRGAGGNFGVITQLTSNDASDGQPVWSKRGRIAFASDADGDLELYAMRRDGSDLRQLTHNLVRMRHRTGRRAARGSRSSAEWARRARSTSSGRTAPARIA